MAIISLDIGGTKILGALFDENKNIVDKVKKPSKAEEGFDIFINQVHQVVDTLLIKNDTSIKGIGVGFPSPVDQDGYIVHAANLPVENFNLAEHLKSKYNVPVVVGNDVNLGTFGEYSELGMTHANVIGLFPGTGLGGGIVIDGKLYIGRGYAGELGHIVVKKGGEQCNCGNQGCLESYASKKGILAYMKKKVANGKDTVLLESVKSGVLKSSKLKKAYDNGDELTVKAINKFIENLGMGVGINMNIFNPDIILIGGGIIESFGEEMLQGIKKYAKDYAMKGIFETTQILQSKLGDDAVIYGGYHLIKDQLENEKRL